MGLAPSRQGAKRRQKILFIPQRKISPPKPRLLYDISIATDDSFPAHFQKPPQLSTIPAMRLRMFFQSCNNKLGGIVHQTTTQL